jgi:hypothetical protein
MNGKMSVCNLLIKQSLLEITMAKKIKNPSKRKIIQMMKDGSLSKQYENMIYNHAHKMIKMHPWANFDQLVAEGNMGLVSAAYRYDPKKGCLSTLMYKSIWGSMKNLCIDPRPSREVPMDVTDPVFAVEAREPWLPNFLRELGEDALLLVTSALESSLELKIIISETAPVTGQRAIKKYANKVLGWNPQRVNHAWKEISACLG